MRTWCLVLCIGLFSSLFQAAAMPVQMLHTPVTDVETAHAHADCAPSADEASPAASCQRNGHMCCLGITAAVQDHVRVVVYGAPLLNPVFQTLVLQDRPSKQFKPPKSSHQS